MKERSNFEKVIFAVMIVFLACAAVFIVLSIANVMENLSMMLAYASLCIHSLASGIMDIRKSNKLSAVFSFVLAALWLIILIIKIFA